MNICGEFRKKIIDYIEGQITKQEYGKYKEHLLHCERCKSEYTAVMKLYEILEKDEVPMPEAEFFDNLRVRLRQEEIVLKRYNKFKILRFLIPAAAATVLILLLTRGDGTVEVAVPTAALLEDRTIASLSLDGIVDEELINELTVVEDYLPLAIDEAIDELSDEEQGELIKSLYEKYGIDT